MKMTRQTMFEIYNTIKSLNGSYNKKFKLFLYDNEAVLTPFIKSSSEILKPSESYLEFEQKRNNILQQLADKDDEGNAKTYVDPVTKMNAYQIPNDKMQEVQSKIELLKSEYNQTINDTIKQQKENEGILAEEIELNIQLIPFSCLPDDIDDSYKPLLSIVDRDK